jgi:cyclic pyranopterin phosphate synthase
MVVTGGGEPLLRPDECVRSIRLASEVFDEIALFSNGARLTETVATELRAAGLSYLCWSRHAVDDNDNRRLMGPAAPAAEELLTAAHGGALPVRATCVMNTAGVEHPEEVWRYIDAFRGCGVREFTFKHTYVASDSSVFSSSPANEWSLRHQVQSDPFAGQGEIVGTLPWGPKIRRIGEVQVCHYFEPTPAWELEHQLARSSNLLSDGAIYASLEDQTSLLYRLGSASTKSASRSSMPICSATPSGQMT